MGPLARAAAWIAARLPGSVSGWLYRLGPVTRALRGLLNRSVPEGPQEVEVAAGLLRGARFELDLRLEKDLWLGTYERGLQALLPRLIGPGMAVYDVGANIGYLTVAFARLVGENGRVVAFEPLQENVERLQAALRLNGLGERVELVPAAVGAAAQVGTFYIHRSGGMGKLAGSAGRERPYQTERQVDVISLDAWHDADTGVPPDWVKVDVEGGEGQVLAGAERLLRSARPSWILELHGPEATRQVWLALNQADYRVHRLAAGLPAVQSPAELDWKSYVLAAPAERGLEWGGQ